VQIWLMLQIWQLLSALIWCGIGCKFELLAAVTWCGNWCKFG
jgi:hypothetical protein